MHDIKIQRVCAALLALACMGAPAGAQVRDRGRTARQYGNTSRADLLTGTYELDRSRSDDPQQVASRALDQLPASERDTVSRRLRARLDPPDMLSLERRGSDVSLASSRAPEMTFSADGRLQNETGPAGRRFATRASMTGDRLEVNASGSGGSDFSVTFDPIQGGDSLRVTRRLFDSAVRAPIVVQSVYRRTSESPDWDISANARGDRSRTDDRYDRYDATLVPEGTTVVARLDAPIDLSSARANERVSLTVESAPQASLNGATLEGYILDAPRNTNGRTGVSMEFDTIRLRDGRSGPFEGTVQGIRGPNGDDIAYNGEPIHSDDQSQQAVQRGAIGAALGALIGAVAGGGKGAAIGAVLGGGGAAATVLIDRNDQSRLAVGTTFTIRAETPRR